MKVKGFIELNLKYLVHCPEARADTLESSESAVLGSGQAGRGLVLLAASLSRVLEAGPNTAALSAPETINACVSP